MINYFVCFYYVIDVYYVHILFPTDNIINNLTKKKIFDTLSKFFFIFSKHNQLVLNYTLASRIQFMKGTYTHWCLLRKIFPRTTILLTQFFTFYSASLSTGLRPWGAALSL